MRNLSYFYVVLSLIALPAIAAVKAPSTYNKKEIATARFGDKERQALLQKAYAIRAKVAEAIVGQDHVGQAMQARIVDWLENFGSRDAEPMALHNIGLPGVGKTAVLKVLESLGIPVVYIDAQKFAGGKQNSDVVYRLYHLLRAAHEANGNGSKPYFLVIDELDKVPEEIGGNGEPGQIEDTQPLIGMLNEILSTGKLAPPFAGGKRLDLSNVFIETAMNFSQKEIELFSEEILGAQKSYWDFTEDDVAKLDRWLSAAGSSDSAAAKILARLFRPNTVSRLLPNLLIAKPLYSEDFLKIVKLSIDAGIRKSTEGKAAAKRLAAGYSDAFAAYLRGIAVYAPAGARKTVIKADLLTEQLINIAARATVPGDRSFNRPRGVFLDFDPATSEAIVRVTPRRKIGKELQDGAPFELRARFDERSSSFLTAAEVRMEVAETALAGTKKPKPVTKAEIRKARATSAGHDVRGLAKWLNARLLGQEDLTGMLESDMAEYLSLEGSAAKPIYRIFGGFSGTGKTTSVQLAAKFTGLPVVKINLQDFSSPDDAAAQRFAQDLAARIEQAKAKGPKGKYVLLVEELDKVYEVDPVKREYVTRPVMGHIKDLLNEGFKATSITGAWGGANPVEIDIRDAYTVVTLNLPVSQFDFKADPNQTTHEDMWDAYLSLVMSPQELRETLKTIFRDETVDRLISPRFHIVRPLLEPHYEGILDTVAGQVAGNRFLDAKGERNVAGVNLSLSPAYRSYLLREAVIPSEQGRQASEAMRALLSRDITEAMTHLRVTPEFADSPVTILLDFLPATDQSAPSVTATAIRKTRSGLKRRRRLFTGEVALRFPSTEILGKIPEKRLFTAVHEFGHAFTGAYLGLRFEVATVIPPEAGVGGYVKWADGPIQSNTAKKTIALLYSALGSRAMERIFLSEKPKAERSVLEITAGASSDIKMATRLLWKLVYEFGMDPKGGVIERSGLREGMAYDVRDGYFFGEVPHEKVAELAMVLRDAEDALVRMLLAAHPKKHYRDLILEFARKGTMSEREFYELAGMPHPGSDAINVGETSRLQKLYKDYIEPEGPALAAARKFRIAGKTTVERMEDATRTFEANLARRMHVNVNTSPCQDLLSGSPLTAPGSVR